MLTINSLSIRFSSYTGGLRRISTEAIRCLDLTAGPGEVVAIVGQSGAGKSLLIYALLDILPSNASLSGTLLYKGERLTSRRIRELRGRRIAYVPQSVAFLNPLQKVGKHLQRSAMLRGLSRKHATEAAHQALHRYGLPRDVYSSFPFQLSGGMAKRILTASATTFSGDLILADEPTSGLDSTNGRETLTHLRQLADSGKTVILITHDIEAALTIADRISVFCQGVTIEEARAKDFNGGGKLRHQYTRALWAALPANCFTDDLSFIRASSTLPGCPFALCCDNQGEQCQNFLPGFFKKSGGRVRCWHA